MADANDHRHHPLLARAFETLRKDGVGLSAGQELAIAEVVGAELERMTAAALTERGRADERQVACLHLERQLHDLRNEIWKKDIRIELTEELAKDRLRVIKHLAQQLSEQENPS